MMFRAESVHVCLYQNCYIDVTLNSLVLQWKGLFSNVNYVYTVSVYFLIIIFANRWSA